jgi:non-ribosomal peptide synthetase component F
MNGNSQNVLQLFERQVERDPKAIAVTAGHGKLSYGELNRLAEELAA